MNKTMGVLAAAVLAAACGAARAGDRRDLQQDNHDWRPSYDHGAVGARDHGDARHTGARPRLTEADCGDFNYRDWLPRRQTYTFWSPKDKSWYYWCSASDGYLPYDQFEAHPAKPGVVPDMPKGLPPLAPGGVDREADPPGQDLMPPALPDDGPPEPEAHRFHPAGDKGAPAH